MEGMFDWKPEFSVHMPHIDKQHQELFRLAENLYRAMASGQGKQALEATLDRLVKYTEEHFSAEERLMRLNDYTAQVRHKTEHIELTRQVKQFQADFTGGRTTMAVPVLQFLRNWLEHHIKGSDMQLAAFIRQRTAQ
jgi:hemerythrin